MYIFLYELDIYLYTYKYIPECPLYTAINCACSLCGLVVDSQHRDYEVTGSTVGSAGSTMNVRERRCKRGRVVAPPRLGKFG